MRPAAVALCALRERALAVPQRAFQVSGCSAQELSALAAQLHTLRQRLVAATPAPPVSSTPPEQEPDLAQLDKVLYTARAHTTGGRDGHSRTDDGRLDVQLSSPGGAGQGTNPEQLFAAGYSACFIGAMKAVAARQKIALPADLAIDAEVDLGPVGSAFGIAVRLAVQLPGMERAAAQALIDAAHQVCPYSNATRGNIEVALSLV